MDLIEQTISGCLLAHDTTNDFEGIYTADDKSMRCMDGVYRTKFANGDSSYGTRIFSKIDLNGEEDKWWRLMKFANGDIFYQEEIHVIDKDDGWRVVTRYKFDDTSLEWIKVE